MKTSLIQNYIPEYRMRQVDRIRVRASPEVAWPVVRPLDIQESRLSRLLFALRKLPEVLTGRRNSLENTKAQTSGIESFIGPGKGFQILDEEPGREIVVGSVGKFWKSNIEWANFTAQNFASFSNPTRFGLGLFKWGVSEEAGIALIVLITGASRVLSKLNPSCKR